MIVINDDEAEITVFPDIVPDEDEALLHVGNPCPDGGIERKSNGLIDSPSRESIETAQNENLAGIGRMVSFIAHEMRNPLQSIRMGVDSIRNDVEERSGRLEVLEEIAYAVDVLKTMTKDLLDYSKPMSLNTSRTSISEVVEHSVRAVREELDHTTVHLELDQADRTILVDFNKMVQVLVNLLSNALEAMPDGGRLSIASRFLDVDGQTVLELSVSDSGVGIPEEDLERVQQPFVTTKTHGVGLGIPICKKIISAHNGSFAITSRVNRGSVVAISLPVENPKSATSGRRVKNPAC